MEFLVRRSYYSEGDKESYLMPKDDVHRAREKYQFKDKEGKPISIWEGTHHAKELV